MRGVGRRALAPAGWLLLLAGEATVLFLPPGPATIALAAAATVLLALDRRYGPLSAALLVTIALPFGRAADVDVVRIASVPLRPQDGAIAVGAIGALIAAARRPRSAPQPRLGFRRGGAGRPRFDRPASIRPIVPVAAVGLFLAFGVVALTVGASNGNAARDVLRDVRWWFLYAAMPLALLAGTSRGTLVRGLVGGAAAFSALVVITALLPLFPGALRAQATSYDWGTMRLQFTNDAFVLAALAWTLWTAVRRPRVNTAALVACFGAALLLSETRTTLLLAGCVAGFVVLAAGWSVRTGRAPARRTAVAGAGAVACLAGGALLATATLIALPKGVVLTRPAPPPAGHEQKPVTRDDVPAVIARITFTSPEGSLQSIDSGRFQAYRIAAREIADAPLLGRGLGALVHTDLKFGNSKPEKPGYSPGVDDAYLTIAFKAGIAAALAFAALLASPLLGLLRVSRRRLAPWYLAAWLALLGLTVTQSYASSGYGPFALALVLAIPVVGFRPPGRAGAGGATAARDMR